MKSEPLSTSDATEYLGTYPHFLAEVRRKVPDFPCHVVGNLTGRGNGIRWDKDVLDAIKLLRSKGLPWLVCARVAMSGRMMSGSFVVASDAPDLLEAM